MDGCKTLTGHGITKYSQTAATTPSHSYTHFHSDQGIEQGKKQSKMAGRVHFDLQLDPPDNGVAVRAKAALQPEAQLLPADREGAPAPPWLPYAPGPGTYTHL
jgi:hypothetical protein